MIDYYYHTYDDNVEQLCGRIKTHCLVYSVSDNIDCENDIMIIHAIYHIVTTTPLYRKNEIKELLWKKIKPLCQIDDTPYSSRGNIRNFERGYNELFDFCWKQKFSKTNDVKSAIKLSKIAYANRSFVNKLFNSNISLVLFTLIFFYLQRFVNDSFFSLEFIKTNEMALTFCVILSSLIFTIGLLTGSTKKNAYYYFPIIAMIVLFIWTLSELFQNTSYSSDVSAEITISLIKRNVIMGMSYLLWYPIICCNNDRLHDLYD